MPLCQCANTIDNSVSLYSESLTWKCLKKTVCSLFPLTKVYIYWLFACSYLQVVAPINYMLDTVPFNMHCYSLDWHPADHVSFSDNAHLRKIAPTSKVQVGHKEITISDLIRIALGCLSYLPASNNQFPQNPSACQTYDVVTFEAHDSIPRMDQIMWPRHCVQVKPFFLPDLLWPICPVLLASIGLTGIYTAADIKAKSGLNWYSA